MTTRVADILTRVRDSLSDEDASRWSNGRLLRLIDEAQKKIATKAQLLRRTCQISVVASTNEYQLPSDAFLITRVVNADGASLPIISHANMDNGITIEDNYHSHTPQSLVARKTGIDWESDVGSEVEAIIFDNQNPGWFKTYPIIDIVDGGETFITDDYGVAVTIESDQMLTDYGVVVDTTTNGLLTQQFNSVYGLVTDMSSVEETLKVYYRARPTEITATTDELEIDEKWDAAIKHYVVGMAFHDDQDTLNRQKSADELDAYKGEFEEAKRISAKDNVSRSVHRTDYNSEI